MAEFRSDRREMLTGSAALLVMSSSPARAAATPTLPPATRDELAALATAANVPGLAVVIARAGQPATIWCQGSASLTFDAPVGPGTLFHAGSAGKHITAIAILQLVEAGKVSLDAPIGKYLSTTPRAWGDAPLHTLLHHCSGIPDPTGDADFAWDRPYRRDDAFAKWGGRELDFPSGSAFSYSNMAYDMLGWLIEAVSGLSYHDYLKQNIFAPAALPHARVDAGEEVIRGRADGYDYVDGRYRPAVHLSNDMSGGGAGGILLSASDMAPWAAALAGERLLSRIGSQATVAPGRFTSGRPIMYGAGWWIDNYRGAPVYWHAGGMPGYTAMLLRLPSRQLFVGVLTNGEARPLSAIRQIALRAAEYAAPGSTPLSIAAAEMPAADRRTEIVRSILGRSDVLVPTERLASELIASQANAATKAAGAEVGSVPRARGLRSIQPIETFSVGGSEFVRYRFVDQAGERLLLVGWASDTTVYWMKVT